MDGLANLQLLEGATNVEKQAHLPLEWAEQKYGTHVETYLLTQELDGLPATIDGFPGFYEARRKRLEIRLRSQLNARPST